MMQHADRVDEVEALERKRRVVQIGLDHSRVYRFSITPGDFDRWSKIDGPDFRAVLARVVSEATVATTGVEHFLPAKELRSVWLHVIEKLSLPLLVHFRKMVPLVTKTEGGFDLFRVHAGRDLTSQCLTECRQQHPWNTIHHRITEITVLATQIIAAE